MRTGDTLSSWLTVILSLAAAIAVGFGVYLACGREDTEVLESPLMFSVARQLVEGPWGLYGPFGVKNPAVLIHAPLYYRLAALFAWPIHRAGVDPVWASFVAGRAISFVGLCCTVAAAYRLARVDGARSRVGLVGRTSDRGIAGRRRDALLRSPRHAGRRAADDGSPSCSLVIGSPAIGRCPFASGFWGIRARRLHQTAFCSRAGDQCVLLLAAACVTGRLPFKFVSSRIGSRPGDRALGLWDRGTGERR